MISPLKNVCLTLLRNYTTPSFHLLTLATNIDFFLATEWRSNLNFFIVYLKLLTLRSVHK